VRPLGAINAVIRELQLDSTWNNVVGGAFLVAVVVLQRLVHDRRGQETGWRGGP
jgi:ribose/xylose/arabinose/galactoside ABC-type transport system permease subunit